MSILVLVPTYKRGKKQMQELADTFTETKKLLTTELLFITEPDDIVSHEEIKGATTLILPVHSAGGMQDAVNKAIAYYPIDRHDILGVLGDDNRFRSVAWDIEFMGALESGGIAWGDDGVQGERLPTAWFMTLNIVKALGWVANPALNHFYLDNSVLELGRAANCLHYLPDIKIEHLHFSFGKSALDETYVHTMAVGSGDNSRFYGWLSSPQFNIEVEKVKEALRTSA